MPAKIRPAYLSLCGFVAASLLVGRFASAASILIDFEDQTAASATTISETDPSLSAPITFAATDGSAINIVNLSTVPGAINFGNASLQANAPILINFPTDVTSVSVEAGHNDGASYTVKLTAFGSTGGTGTSLGSDTESLFAVGTTFNSTSLEVDANGIRSAVLDSGTGGANGVDFDNVGITTAAATTGGGGTAVPLPNAASMFLGGAAVAAFAGLRMRRTALQSA
jgi:hypothetical protein